MSPCDYVGITFYHRVPVNTRFCPAFKRMVRIDKRQIALGKAAIDRELEQRLPVMFKRGGYHSRR